MLPKKSEKKNRIFRIFFESVRASLTSASSQGYLNSSLCAEKEIGLVSPCPLFIVTFLGIIFFSLRQLRKICKTKTSDQF